MPAPDPYAGRNATSHERRYGPWDRSYQGDGAPWDLGRPQPAIERIADLFTGSVLDAGCGSGEHALLLAARGLEVIGVDVAPTAIAQARAKAEARGLQATFEVEDALRLGRLGRTFDSVLDVGLYHTFDDAERVEYAESLATVTATGSVLHLLCFSDRAPGEGGPRRVSETELWASFAAGWTVVSIHADHIVTTFDHAGVPAWLARVERSDPQGRSPVQSRRLP
jgi:SAM-dependent methyltransferase